MGRRATVTSIVTGAVMLAVVGATPAASTATPCPTEAPQRDAVFEWHRLSEVNTTVTNQRLHDLRCGGFKPVYADISEYVEVAAQRTSRTQQARLLQLKGEPKTFVSRATTEHGLGVHAVAGAPTWTEQARRYLGPMTVDLVAAYNNDPANENLQGVQLDIEPYLERSWSRNVTASLQEFGLVEPEKISFGWVGRAAFQQAAGELVAAYGGRSQFRGLLGQRPGLLRGNPGPGHAIGTRDRRAAA